MGFNPTFYAGGAKLSDITIDSDLNMFGRNISGVNILRASRVDSPYRAEPWPTEEIVIEPHDAGEQVYPIEDRVDVSTTEFTEITRFHTPNSPVTRIWTMWLLNVGSSSTANVNISANGVLLIENFQLPFDYDGRTLTLDLPGNAEIVVSGKSIQGGGAVIHNSSWYKYEGTPGRVIDLTGKWLALGIDMKGLAATVKIQGVDIPYSDYAKYFPLAPTELKFPADWYDSDPRPVVEVYV